MIDSFLSINCFAIIKVKRFECFYYFSMNWLRQFFGFDFFFFFGFYCGLSQSSKGTNIFIVTILLWFLISNLFWLFIGSLFWFLVKVNLFNLFCFFFRTLNKIFRFFIYLIVLIQICRFYLIYTRNSATSITFRSTAKFCR